MKTAKEECEDLLNAVMPFAKGMLTERREFFPFGATMSPSGEIAQTAASTGEEHPDSSSVLAVLESAFHEGAAEGRFKATALVVDVRIVPPGRSAKQDAVEVRLDHQDGYSVRVVFPYSFSHGGDLELEAPFAVAGEKRVFQ